MNDYEQKVFQAHRDAEVSRISSSIANDDLVLVGGRITAGSGFTNTIPLTSSGCDSKGDDGLDRKLPTAAKERQSPKLE